MVKPIQKKKTKVQSKSKWTSYQKESDAKSASLKRERSDDGSDPEECEDESTDCIIGNEVSSMLRTFQSNVNKNMNAKRRRLETLTAKSASNCNSKVENVMANQHKERMDLHREYMKQLSDHFLMWERDMAKAKEEEEKLNVLLQKQRKLLAQIKAVQMHRLKTLKGMQEEYWKTVDDTAAMHDQQNLKAMSYLKKELYRLRGKIMKDAQAQEMAAMRQSFHSMLFK